MAEPSPQPYLASHNTPPKHLTVFCFQNMDLLISLHKRNPQFYSSTRRNESLCKTSPTYWNINIPYTSSLALQRTPPPFIKSHGSSPTMIVTCFALLLSLLVALGILISSHWKQTLIGPEAPPFYLRPPQLPSIGLSFYCFPTLSRS